MKKKLIFLIPLGILVILSILTIFPSNENQQVDGDGQNTDLPKKKYKYQLISNLTWQVYSSPERSVIKARSFRIEKRRFGGFSFGGFNQLVVDDLSVTIPSIDSDDKQNNISSFQDDSWRMKRNIRSSAERILKELPSFSALKINHIKVQVLFSDGSTTNILSAVSGQFKGGRMLELNNCNFISVDGVSYDNTKTQLDLNTFSIKYQGNDYDLFGI